MLSPSNMPSPSSLFSAYASVAASAMFLRSIAAEFLPHPVRAHLHSALLRLFSSRPTHLTLIFDELCNPMTRNQVFDAAELYLATRISPDTTDRLRVTKSPKDKSLAVRLEKGQKVLDRFEGIDLVWRFLCSEQEKGSINNANDPFGNRAPERLRFFELSFEKRYKDLVLGSYVQYVLERAKEMRDSQRALKMFTLRDHEYGGNVKWESINLEHPATFETLAMEPELKKTVVEDLDRFVKRKEFYRRVGRAWKRGYLLYGPPGTGKSSLVAAMANYLKFDVYDLQLANIMRDSDLRKLLVATANRSILVIEDIDCSVEIPDRRKSDGDGDGHGRKHFNKPPGFQVTLSGLLNFIDGLWSTCGDERIIVFTTNHKEKLDPALLRPGRMDMHVHMSYCTPHGFHLLASNYLGVSPDHRLFPEIGALLETSPVTPAQVAEELMKSEDPDVALEGLARAIKRKRMEVEVEAEEELEAVINKGVGAKKKQKKAQSKKKIVSKRNNGNGSRRVLRKLR